MAEPSLVADIGGTNARFAIADSKTRTISRTEKFRAEDFRTIGDAAAAYLKSAGVRPHSGCFAVAAPVGGDEIVLTNSHWKFRPADMQSALNLTRLRVVNDFYALASGIRHLPDDYFISVKPGKDDEDAPKLVMGPGTGLGQALIIPFGAGQRIVATEGGHIAFAPYTDEEIAVMKFIAREHARVSVERVVSGGGIVNIHRSLCVLSSAPQISMRASEITAAAIEGNNPIAVKTVRMFCAVLGRVVGDAVLATGARGGVVLGGGILPKIKDFFLASEFVDCFVDKGRMRSYVDEAPIRMIVKEGAALIGAAALQGTPD